jgi:formyl-CoA transferase
MVREEVASICAQGSRRARIVTSFAPSLDGIRVLELGSTVAGPAAGRLLADLGADVIKIEPPEGDGLRTWGIPAPDGTSWWFKSHNRNKRFVALDLHVESDRERVRELVRDADVVLENFRPGRMAAWGLGYDDLHALNPRLVYAAISGFGQDGPYAHRVGFGNIAESMGGLRYISGFPDRPPVRPGISLGDELAGLYCVVGILAALRARERDGIGDFVDVSLLESCINLMQGALPEFGATGVVRERQGNSLGSTAPSNIYPTKDGRWLAIGANANAIFGRFCNAIGRPDVASDARFASNRERTENADALDAIVAEWSKTIDCDVAAKLLTDAGVPAGPLNSVADIVADEHVRARGVIVPLADDAGNIVSTTLPVPRLRRHRAVSSHAARAIGADTDAVLGERS